MPDFGGGGDGGSHCRLLWLKKLCNTGVAQPELLALMNLRDFRTVV